MPRETRRTNCATVRRETTYEKRQAMLVYSQTHSRIVYQESSSAMRRLLRAARDVSTAAAQAHRVHVTAHPLFPHRTNHTMPATGRLCNPPQRTCRIAILHLDGMNIDSNRQPACSLTAFRHTTRPHPPFSSPVPAQLPPEVRLQRPTLPNVQYLGKPAPDVRYGIVMLYGITPRRCPCSARWPPCTRRRT